MRRHTGSDGTAGENIELSNLTAKNKTSDRCRLSICQKGMRINQKGPHKETEGGQRRETEVEGGL